MANRREFIQAGAAATTLAVPGMSALAAGFDTLPFYKVVYDERASAAVQFGTEARRRGASVAAMRGDVHDLWYDDLYHRWRESRAPVAGMTRYNAMFLLSMFAQDAGLRVIYRGHHRLAADGSTRHELFGPAAALSGRGALQSADERWGQAAAGLVLRWPANATSIARANSSIAEANRRAIGPDALVSWIMAPPRRA